MLAITCSRESGDKTPRINHDFSYAKLRTGHYDKKRKSWLCPAQKHCNCLFLTDSRNDTGVRHDQGQCCATDGTHTGSDAGEDDCQF